MDTTVILLFLICSVVHAQSDCLCPAGVHGPQTQLTTLPHHDVLPRIAANPFDGSYFIGWTNYRTLMLKPQSTVLYGQIFDRTMTPISPLIEFENNPNHENRDTVELADAVFNSHTREYFILTANTLVAPSGNKFDRLQGHIISERGSIRSTNIPIADTLDISESFLSSVGTQIIFNPINREYIIKHTIFVRNQPRTVIQSYDEQGMKKLNAEIIWGLGKLTFNFQANQFVFVNTFISWNGNYTITAKMLNSKLDRFGPLHTVLSVPNDVNDPYIHSSPFTIYNPVRHKFVIFWYEGPSTNAKIFERSLSSTSQLEPPVYTGINRWIKDIRYNPVTHGYFIVVRSNEIFHVNSGYKITSIIPVACQNLGLAPTSVGYNRVNREFLLVWWFPITRGENLDLYSRRFAASIPNGLCN